MDRYTYIYIHTNIYIYINKNPDVIVNFTHITHERCVINFQVYIYIYIYHKQRRFVNFLYTHIYYIYVLYIYINMVIYDNWTTPTRAIF